MIRGILVGALVSAGALIAFHVYAPAAIRWFWATEIERTAPRRALHDALAVEQASGAPLYGSTGPQTLRLGQLPTDDTKTPQTGAWAGEGWKRWQRK